MALAGRCECGVLRAWADTDAHLSCRGLRRCRDCRAVKALATGFRPQRRLCRACQDAYHLAYIRRRMATDEAFRERHREASRKWGKDAYRNKPGYADEMKAKNRSRYRTDPEHAERIRARWRARHRRAA